jgi:hypothetical protein
MVWDSATALAFVFETLIQTNVRLKQRTKQEPFICMCLFTALCYKFLSLFVIGGLK